MAHNNFKVVSSLLEQLDAPEFDVFIHVNAKVKNYPEAEWREKVRHAGLYFVPRVKVGYCDYSMVRAVVSLFRMATSHGPYDYYHLISGADLLIKKREDFLEFFSKNNGAEFVGFSSDYDKSRYLYRHWFTALGRQPSHFWSVCFIRLRKLLIELQKRLGLKKEVRGFQTIKKGTDWYSITDSAAHFLLKSEELFRKDFFRAYCPTEFFPHTVLYNSSFRNHLHLLEKGNENLSCLREIDWERGSPYIYDMCDRELLLASKGMFARKFDENKDMEIVDFLREYVKG